MIRPIAQSALQGLRQARSGMRNAALEIARAPLGDRDSTPDLTRSLLELKRHEHAARANLKVLKTGLDTLGTLLDERA